MRQILNTLLIAVLSRPSRPQQRQSAGTSVVILGWIENRKVSFWYVIVTRRISTYSLLRLPLSPMLPSVLPGLVSLLVSLIISSASHCFAYLECAMSRPPHRVPSPAPLRRSF